MIDTERFSAILREALFDAQGRILISSFAGSEQAEDLSEAANCQSLGRIRHFRRTTSVGWPDNPLPIEPAARALKLEIRQELTAEVFQLAGCNWRCWYCYVPFDRLSAKPNTGRWISPAEIVDMYAALADRPPVLVLSGGQPDLVPEWLPNTMRALRDRNLDQSCYLWSDDNLSNDYLWRFVKREDRDLMRSYQNYGRVGCFKGFDQRSFVYNTRAHPSLFDSQFDLFGRLLDLGLNIFAYVTLTSDDPCDVDRKIGDFVDRLQRISRMLPLRVVPLEIQQFTPLVNRVAASQVKLANDVQQQAVVAWNRELNSRFSASERATNVCDIRL